MNSDAAIVDTFLHTQDTAYSVPDVLDFVEKNGLAFKGWLDSALYNQEMVGLGYNIPDRDRWSIVENLSGRMGQHRFMASSLERDSKSEITFEDKNWVDYFPLRNPELQPSNFDPNKGVRGSYEFMMSPLEVVLLAEATGRKSIAQIMKHKSLVQLDMDKRTALVKEFYLRMWRLGHVFYSTVPIKRRHNEAAS
jgi:hypothetical protein